MSWPRTRNRRPAGSGCLCWRILSDAHGVLPVHPVAVRNRHRDGAADRPAVTHTRENLRRIVFNGHAAAAAVAPLPAPEIDIQIRCRGSPLARLDDRDERAAVDSPAVRKRNIARSFYRVPATPGAWKRLPAHFARTVSCSARDRVHRSQTRHRDADGRHGGAGCILLEEPSGEDKSAVVREPPARL